MKLAKKTFMAIALTLGVLIAIQFFFTRAIILKGFDHLEMMSAQQNVARVKDAIQEQINNIEMKGVDWAMWDDAYNFIQDENKGFAESNLQDSALTGLKLNLMIFLQKKSGKLIFGKMADIENGTVSDVPASTLTHIQENPQLTGHKELTDHLNGIILLSDGPMMITSQPIIKSDGSGPAMGTLIFGKKFDTTATQNLSKLTHLEIATELAGQLSPSYQEAQKNLPDVNANFIKISSEEKMIGYGLIQDVYGKPALYFSVIIPRDVYAQAKATLFSFLLAMVIGGLLLTIVMNIVVNRSVVNPIITLNDKIQEIGQSGNLSLRVPAKGKDEIAELSNEMNKMLHSIAESKNSMKRLLDNTQQGFLAFDNKGIISQEFSKSVLAIFEQNPAGKHIASIFHQEESAWNEYVSAIFAEALPFADLLALCPKEILVHEKHIELLYKDIRNTSDTLTHVMVVATDVTELRKLQQQKEEEGKINNAIIKILLAKSDFAENVEMANHLDQYIGNLNEFKRKLHTLKGSFGFLGCTDFSLLCHHFEDQLKENHSPELLQQACQEIKLTVNEFVQKYQHILKVNSEHGRTLEVPSAALHFILDTAYKTNASKNLIQQLSNLLERPVNESFGWIENVFKASAEKAGKEVLPAIYLKSATLDPDLYRELISSLIHIPRNSADHGLESPCDRECFGKPRAGQLTLQLQLKENFYYLIIKDDGCGVSLERVQAKALSLGLKRPETIEEACELLFADGFSTKDEISETSGRGVGLSAIREEARKLGGDVKMESVEGEGSTITVWFKKI